MTLSPGFRTRQDAADCSRQRGLRHRLQQSRWRERHVCLRRCWRWDRKTISLTSVTYGRRKNCALYYNHIKIVNGVGGGGGKQTVNNLTLRRGFLSVLKLECCGPHGEYCNINHQTSLEVKMSVSTPSSYSQKVQKSWLHFEIHMKTG